MYLTVHEDILLGTQHSYLLFLEVCLIWWTYK